MFEHMMGMQSSIWDDFQRLQRELDSLFGPGLGRTSIRSVAGGTFPAINVGTTEDAVQVYVFAPGIDMDQLDLSIQRNVLTLSGARNQVQPGSEQPQADFEQGGGSSRATGGYHLRERFNGSFRRVVGLPEDVDPEQIDATYRNGVLMIKIAKKETAKPRQIQVQAH